MATGVWETGNGLPSSLGRLARCCACDQRGRVWAALSLLLVMAGDVETNPGPISDELLAQVDDSELNLSDDRYDVIIELMPVSANWRDIGIALGLHPSTLDGIAGSPDACLKSMVTEWLKGRYDVKRFGPPTWRKLVEAMRDPGGRTNKELARNIARRHKERGGGGSQPVAASRQPKLPEDTSMPKFTNKKSVMRQFDPVTLHVQRTDETTVKAVQLFATQVVVILHTCNANEYWAALERLEPPTKGDGSNIRDRPITYPQVGSVIGWFAGYRAAVVRTGQGNKCRDELATALTKSFPNGKAIIGAGIAYANNQKRKFADVLISDQIENFVQYKIVDSEITNRGPREEISPNVQSIFENPARDWTEMEKFPCAENDRPSKAHIGCIVSAPTLVRDEMLKQQLMKHTPDCIGGEMEGWVLLELKKTLKGQHNKDIEVIVIKGVADYGDCTKGDDWQWTAAKAAMDCIHYCLEKSGGSEFNAIDL